MLNSIALFLNKEMGKSNGHVHKGSRHDNDSHGSFHGYQDTAPVPLALKETVLPSKIDWLTILTLVGGTVGYITFAGAPTVSSTQASRAKTISIRFQEVL